MLIFEKRFATGLHSSVRSVLNYQLRGYGRVHISTKLDLYRVTCIYIRTQSAAR